MVCFKSLSTSSCIACRRGELVEEPGPDFPPTASPTCQHCILWMVDMGKHFPKACKDICLQTEKHTWRHCYPWVLKTPDQVRLDRGWCTCPRTRHLHPRSVTSYSNFSSRRNVVEFWDIFGNKTSTPALPSQTEFQNLTRFLPSRDFPETSDFYMSFASHISCWASLHITALNFPFSRTFNI